MTTKTLPEPEVDTAPESTEPSQVDTFREVRREATRLGKRWRRQALPFVAIGGTHGIGAASAALSGPAALLPVAAGWTATAGTYGYACRHAPRWDRLYAGVAALGSAGWQAALGFTGADGLTASLLWACGCALAVPWWARHAEPDPDVTAELASLAAQPAAIPSANTPDPRVVAWDEHLGAKNAPLAGSMLSEVAELAHGWRAAVQLPIGEHWTTVMNARKAILSVYGLPDGRVYVEAIPGASVRTARLTVLTSDPLQAVTRWKRPGLDHGHGTFPLMTTADGETLNYRFWWPGQGAAHALVSGVNGSGKTKVLDLILAESGASDRIVPYVIDGGGGASLPQWTDRVPLAAETPADARKLLKYVLRIMKRRRKAIKRQGGGSLEPTPEMPLIAVVIDEAHKLLMNDEIEGVDNSDIKQMCEKLTQEGRKYGISLVLSTQVPSAKQLGGSTVLRDQLKGGTVVGLRVTERTSGNMISSGAPMPEALHELPAEFPDGTPTRGLGYVLTSRMIRARSLLIENPAEHPMTEVSLDADSAAEPVPTLTGEDEDEAPDVEEAPARHLHSLDTSSGDAEEHVNATIEAGTPSDAVSLMRATGLTLAQVRRALAGRE